MLRELTQERERAQRLAARADAAERKRQEQLAHESGLATAKTMRAQLDQQLTELETLLTSRLASPPQLTFAMMKRSRQVTAFDPGELGEPHPAPRWEDYEPPSPGRLSGLVGGKARHARARDAGWEAFQRALADHEHDEAVRARRLKAARGEYDRMARAETRRSETTTPRLMSLSAVSGRACPDAVEEYFGQALALSQYPSWVSPRFPGGLSARSPRTGRRVPAAAQRGDSDRRDFRYVKARREIDELARPVKRSRTCTPR